MPRLGDIRITGKKRGGPTYRIELVRQPVGRRYSQGSGSSPRQPQLAPLPWMDRTLTGRNRWNTCRVRTALATRILEVRSVEVG